MKQTHAELATQLKDAIDRKLPEGFEQSLPTYEAGKSLATRAASGDAINAIAQLVPSLFGGSADLAGSNNTTIKGSGDFLPAIILDEIYGSVYENLQWELH